MSDIFCKECGEFKRPVWEPENAWSKGFWIYGCDCDVADECCGYGATKELAGINYLKKHHAATHLKG